MIRKYSSKIKNTINLIIFISIATFIFTTVTYVFRNTSYDRDHISGISAENNYDVVCIGGSSTFVYWEPFTAWNEFGITSYDLAANSFTPPILDGLLHEAIKSNPKLIVIDLRSFGGNIGALKDSEGPVRNYTDSLNFWSINRLRMLNEVFKYFDTEGVGRSSYYIDIFKYHDNHDVLGDSNHWRHYDNNTKSEYLGWEFVPSHAFLDEPKDFKTSKRTPLSDSNKEILLKAMNFLSENHTPAIFVTGPIPITSDQEAYMNSLGDFISENGFTYINTNDHYEDMGIDFRKDFYNNGHVNVFGAEKYTRYLSKYIQTDFQIPKHKNKAEIEKWNGYYYKAHEKDVETKDEIEKAIESKEKAYSSGQQLKCIDNFYEWIGYADNENYTVVIAQDHKINMDAAESNLLNKQWDIDSEASEEIRICTANNIDYQSDQSLDEDLTWEVGTGNLTRTPGYKDKFIVNSGKKCAMKFNDSDISCKHPGIHILIYDNNFNSLLDAADLYNDSNGDLCINHCLTNE